MKYDVLYRNGKIFTSDKENLYAEAMAVKDGKIAWVGKDADADPGSAAQVEDLGGKRVLPGFVDSHMHAIMLADCYQQISALPPAVSSIAQLQEEIKKTRASQQAGQWIMGWGYDEGKLAEGCAPSRYDLD